VPEEDLTPYAVRFRREIESILTGLVKARSVLRIEDSARRNALLSTLLGFDSNAAYIEGKSDNPIEKDLLSGRGGQLSVFCEGVEVRWKIGSAQRAQYDGVEALRIPIPESLYRIQRRQCFRMRVGQSTPSVCRIRNEAGEELLGVVLDISLSGVGLRMDFPEAPFPIGTRLNQVRLNLPELGEHAIELIVRNAAAMRLKSGTVVTRIGCEFNRLPRDMERVLQTYLFKLEAERRALAG